MRITRRTKAMAFFIVLGICLVALAVTLNVSWIIFHWRQVVPLVLGIILFGLLIAGVVVNTIFLVREIRRNEQQDSFLNAITHELKTPIASIRLYLETLQKRSLDEAQRGEFYRIMLEDTDRLLGTVEQVLKASQVRQGSSRQNWQEVDFARVVRDALGLARLRQHLSDEAMYFGAEPGPGITVMGNAEELPPRFLICSTMPSNTRGKKRKLWWIYWRRTSIRLRCGSAITEWEFSPKN